MFNTRGFIPFYTFCKPSIKWCKNVQNFFWWGLRRKNIARFQCGDDFLQIFKNYTIFLKAPFPSRRTDSEPNHLNSSEHDLGSWEWSWEHWRKIFIYILINNVTRIFNEVPPALWIFVVGNKWQSELYLLFAVNSWLGCGGQSKIDSMHK